MSVKAITWAFSQALPSTTKLVLVALADYADGQGKCWPGQASIASKCGLTDRAVRTHLEELKKAGLIDAETRRDARGRMVISRYTINFKSDEDGAENDGHHRNIVPHPPEYSSGIYKEEPSLNSTNNGGAADAASAPIDDDALKAEWCPDADIEIVDNETHESVTLRGDWAVSAGCYLMWSTMFGKLDIDYQLDRAAVWYRENPRRHKRNVRKFLTNWLSRAHAGMQRGKPMFQGKSTNQVRH